MSRFLAVGTGAAPNQRKPGVAAALVLGLAALVDESPGASQQPHKQSIRLVNAVSRFSVEDGA